MLFLGTRLITCGIVMALAVNFDADAHVTPNDTAKVLILSNNVKPDTSSQRDIVDLIRRIFSSKASAQSRKAESRVNFSFIPVIGYTLSGGFAAGLSSVSTFYTQKDHALNTSVINTQALYDTHSQLLWYTQANLWAWKDRIKFVGDWRVSKFPDTKYGLGTLASAGSGENIDYDYIRLYNTVYGRVIKNLYVGGGINLDYHYNITYDTLILAAKPKKRGAPLPPPTTVTVNDFSRSFGYNLSFLFDDRDNPVNATNGYYVSSVYRNNIRGWGSRSIWQSAQVDARKYVSLSKHRYSVLAFWMFGWYTFQGTPPYLDIPYIGGDMYNNTGRGYAVGRYRDYSMLYAESEYRFSLMKSGFLGGVLFANAASYTNSFTLKMSGISPAGGAGLRIKMNKHANTNLCIDYGIGTDNSRGLFVNLGEVF